jgi:hypothetical protein
MGCYGRQRKNLLFIQSFAEQGPLNSIRFVVLHGKRKKEVQIKPKMRQNKGFDDYQRGSISSTGRCSHPSRAETLDLDRNVAERVTMNRTISDEVIIRPARLNVNSESRLPPFLYKLLPESIRFGQHAQINSFNLFLYNHKFFL